ncbi:hypothetical protein Pint_19626 [Pistacia integerrima]|uniref:Uncharacterized protein n=1 Tax=Pistacia integerrima TaxID=434235 RepID=A0ACC0XCY3_9ROSI|nr:hypothetical protein Pint_19626 [Pistacia integerrima]
MKKNTTSVITSPKTTQHSLLKFSSILKKVVNKSRRRWRERTVVEVTFQVVTPHQRCRVHLFQRKKKMRIVKAEVITKNEAAQLLRTSIPPLVAAPKTEVKQEASTPKKQTPSTTNKLTYATYFHLGSNGTTPVTQNEMKGAIS